MAFFPILVLVCLIVWAWFGVRSRHGRSSAKFPPGPYPLPIIGNILQLGRSPHISLANLSKKYGPLMFLKLGSVNTIVISSPEMAKEILQKQDNVFSNRTVPLAAKVYDYHKHSIGFMPVGDQWKMFRNICREHMFCTHQLDKSEPLRQEKFLELRNYVAECCDTCSVVNIGETAFMMTLNLMSATLFSYDFGRFDSDSAQRVRRMVRAMVEALGAPNLADFFPVFKATDLQGIMGKARSSYGKLLEFFVDIINERLASRSSSSAVKTDFLEVLIRLGQESESGFGCDQIKHVLLDLFVGATDTTSTTVEWAMTELLRNPEKMSKVKDELQAVIGEHSHVRESDISRLPYLHAVVKETLRYHPTAPLAVPHKAEADTEINGYTIPKNAQVLVNICAIGRDSSVWSNADSFEPERFIEANIDFKGQDFEFIPFSSGRRMCVGWSLAIRMVTLVLASLLNGFHWSLEGGMEPDEIDMTERFGISLEKAIPLKVIPAK